MKLLISTFFLVLEMTLLCGQNNPSGTPCDFAKLLDEGRNDAKLGDYTHALLKFNAARRCNPSKGKEVEVEIELVFSKIQRQRDEAEKAKKRAREAEFEAKVQAFAAQRARDSSISAQKIAEHALIELKNKTEEVVRFILLDAEKLILNLNYEGAWEKLYSAAGLKVLTRTVANMMLEPAFWYTEIGSYDRAIQMLNTIADTRLLNNIEVRNMLAELSQMQPKDKLFHLRTCIAALDKETYVKLQERYYPVMLPVLGGEFIMGDVMADGINENEKTHSVSLSGFEIAVTETTVWQWSIFCMSTRKDMMKYYLEPSWNDTGNNPVLRIFWKDAVDYANWLNERYWRITQLPLIPSIIWNTGLNNFQLNLNAPGFRLPTEAEWEFASRGRGKIVRFGNGKDTANTKEINFGGFSQRGEFTFYIPGEPQQRTSAVGSLKSPNALGLHDMSGNAWEWCWDWYATYPQTPQKDYIGPETGSRRVLRGGSCFHFVEYCRVAYRNSMNPESNTNDVIGFRLARTP